MVEASAGVLALVGEREANRITRYYGAMKQHRVEQALSWPWSRVGTILNGLRLVLVGIALVSAVGASGCSNSDDSNKPGGTSRDKQALAVGELVDMSWKAEVGEEYWLVSENNMIDEAHVAGKPDPSQRLSRSRITRRFRIVIVEVNAAKHPTKLQVFVEQHSQDYLEAPAGSGDAGPWSPASQQSRRLFPPEKTKFMVAWDEKLGRWDAVSAEDKQVFGKATQDMRAMFESRWLREEIPETAVRIGGTWKGEDAGRVALAQSMLGDDAEYTLELSLDPNGSSIEESHFYLINAKRRLKGKVSMADGVPDQPLEIISTSRVNVFSGEVFRVMASTIGDMTIPDIGGDNPSKTTRRRIDNQEQFAPARR